MVKYYYTNYSVMGLLHDGTWMQFDTVKEYMEYYFEEVTD